MRFSITLFALLPCLLTAQSPLQGRIVDARTEEALAFATIAYGKQGSYTNADGYYALDTGASTDSVLISFIGYRPLRTTVAGLRASPTVRMQPTANELTEIVVRGEDERLYALLERCRKDLQSWPVTKAKTYFQLATTLDSTPTEFMQNYYNLTFSGQGVMGLELKAGRVAVQMVDSLDYRSLGTSQSIAHLSLTERAPDFADHPLQLVRKVLRRAYYLSELPTFSDASTVHLRFDPVHEDLQLFGGELWMDATTAELKKLILRHPALTKNPFTPINSVDSLGALDVEFIYTFTGRRLEHLQWRYAYDHYTDAAGQAAAYHHIAADCSLICFEPNAAFFSPRTEYPGQYGDYRKLAFFPYDTLFWRHAPRVPLTERQQRQLTALGMDDYRVDYGWHVDSADRSVVSAVRKAGLDNRNLFWSPRWRYVHDTPTPEDEIRGNRYFHDGTAPAVQLFLDAFPLGDSLSFNSATFLDVYATQLTVEPSDEYNAALNIYFDLCELLRRDMLAELRAGPVALEEVGRTYDRYREEVARLRRKFFRQVRRGRDERAMLRYNQEVVEGLGVNNLELFRLYAYGL